MSVFVGIYTFVSLAICCLGVTMVVGRETFARNVAKTSSGLPTTPRGVAAMGWVAVVVSPIPVLLMLADPASLKRQGAVFDTLGTASGVIPRFLSIVFLVVALTLGVTALLVVSSARRRHELSANAGGRSSFLARRVIYALICIATGCLSVAVAAGLSVAWFS